MSRQLPSPLPTLDRSLLRLAKRAVPAGEQAEWLRTWEAELWHMHHRGRSGGDAKHSAARTSWRVRADLSLGLLRDALWLGAEDCRRSLRGTPGLCLGRLLGLCGLSGLLAVVLSAGWHALRKPLTGELERCLPATVLVVLVACVTNSSRHAELDTPGKKLSKARRQLFFSAKSALVLLLAFLLSADLCRPLCEAFPPAGELVQIFVFVLFALLALRWAFADQEQRCKRCLRLMRRPSRVGRPSRNLLEWSGTEQICEHGHGSLSVPEMASSWRQYSQWVDGTAGWDPAAGI